MYSCVAALAVGRDSEAAKEGAMAAGPCIPSLAHLTLRRFVR